MKVPEYAHRCNVAVAATRTPPRRPHELAVKTGIPLSVIVAHFLAAGIGGRNV